MGYHAPSAEDVYRYAFRLDRDRSLTDRFGFSIVFVNDTSPLSREFLQTYCLDLCFRTADRIRFIFFSELPNDVLDDVASDMNAGRARGGFLQNVLGFFGLRRDADFEHDPWRTLRPSALRPLRTVDDISERMNWECDLHTAMPGAGMAMQFAQRLGIGRYVPCFVIFTDVGDLHVDVLPIAGLDVERVYHHVRAWVDEFYARNRATIDKWNEVEHQITTLTSRVNKGLREIDEWRNNRINSWQAVADISAMIRAVENDDWGTLVAQFDRLPRWQWGDAAGPVIHEYRERFKELENVRRVSTRLTSLVSDLASVTDAGDILRALRAAQDAARAAGVSVPAAARHIASLEERLSVTQTPLGLLETWWRISNRNRLSLKFFKGERRRWEQALSLPRIESFRQEFDVLRRAVEKLPLCHHETEDAAKALREYGADVGLDITSDRWHAETAHYESIITTNLKWIRSSAPSWLCASSPALTIGEAFPWSKERDESTTAQIVARRPALQAAMDAMKDHVAAAVRADIEALDALSVSCRDSVVSELIPNLVSAEECARQQADLRGDLLAELRVLRRRLEGAATAAMRDLPSAPGWNEDVAREFHHALDLYAEVVRALRYPHREDPLLRRVRLDMALPEATGTARAHREETSTVEQLRESLQETGSRAQASARLVAQASEAATRATPAARLATACCKAVYRLRLIEVLGRDAGPGVGEAVQELIAEGRLATALGRFTDVELNAIATDLGRAPLNAENPLDEVLTSLGLYTVSTASSTAPWTEEAVAAKVAADDFDVFMAHNNRDKPLILELGRRLRAVGIYPWIDVEQIPPGRWFQDVIQSIVPRVRAAAICIGQEGLGRWQTLELHTFMSQCVERGLPTIPVLLPGVADLPKDTVFLRELNMVRFIGGLDDHDALRRLAWGITGMRLSESR